MEVKIIKLNLLKRSIDQWIYEFDKEKMKDVKFYFKKIMY